MYAKEWKKNAFGVMDKIEATQMENIKKVNIPFSVQKMQFRCPDMAAHVTGIMLCPKRFLISVFQALKGIGASENDPIVCGNRGRKKYF